VSEAWSGVLFFTTQELFFPCCIKCFVLKVWLQPHAILCHPEGYLLLANFGASEKFRRGQKHKTVGKGASQHAQRGACWLGVTTYPAFDR